MDDITILNILFEDAGVKRSSLLAQYINTIDNYFSIDDEKIAEIQWVDKDGNMVQMIPDKQIKNIVTKRELYLKGVSPDKRNEKIKSVALELLHVPVLKEVLKFFTSSQKATKVAVEINSIDNIDMINNQNSDILSGDERNEVLNFFSKEETRNIELLSVLPKRIDILIDSFLLINRIHGIGDLETKVIKQMKKNVFKYWFSIVEKPDSLKDTILSDAAIPNYKEIEETVEMFVNLIRLININEKYFDIALLYLEEILKMKDSVPKMASEAITTGNPFLFRSLFLSFDEAKEFAAGGKLNSSLETKYGNLFEKLMSAFGHCRGIYNGGIDVVVGQEAFDIKSGPNVMNKSQVDAFSLKRRLIEKEGLLPGLSSYKIALGYGKPEQLNSFMATIESEILTGRQAWKKITGIEYSPEIAFEIARLVASLFRRDSLVSSMLGYGNNYKESENDENQFKLMFNDSFEELTPSASEEAQNEINKIKALVR